LLGAMNGEKLFLNKKADTYNVVKTLKKRDVDFDKLH
jgi:hypothetical protein